MDICKKQKANGSTPFCQFCHFFLTQKNLTKICKIKLKKQLTQKTPFAILIRLWRVGWAVESGGLENRWCESILGFESLALRQENPNRKIRVFSLLWKWFDPKWACMIWFESLRVKCELVFYFNNASANMQKKDEFKQLSAK